MGAQKKMYMALNSIERKEDREGWFMEKNKYFIPLFQAFEVPPSSVEMRHRNIFI